jgi:hypothetical protein
MLRREVVLLMKQTVDRCESNRRCRRGRIMSLPYDADDVRSGVASVAEDEPEIRVEKVLQIRRELGEGTYGIADRLDVVIERIIRELG